MTALASVAVSACSPLAALDRLVPDDTYRSTVGISYGSHPREQLDLYRPNQASDPTPVVVFFYGGSWKSGERGHYRFVGEALARRGLTVVIPDYRLYPEVRFPAFLHDGAAAVRWVLDEVAAHGGDPGRVFLAGHSAGAYNAAMLAVDSTYLAAAGKPPAEVCGVISLAGPISFDPLSYNSTRPVFAGAEDAASIRRIRPGAPPFLLMHGLSDSTVYPANAEEFAAKLEATGNAVTLELLPGMGHYRIIAALAAPFEGWLFPLGDRIAAFANARPPCSRALSSVAAHPPRS